MKLTLLIPLLFFMTSCSIDWNDEKITELEQSKSLLITDLEAKNKKIAELEAKVQVIKTPVELEQSISVLEADVFSKNAKITELEQQIQSLNTAIKLSKTNISLNPTNNPQYANLLVQYYEGGESYLIDLQNGKIVFKIPNGEAKKVTKNGNTLTVVVAGIYAANKLYTYDTAKGAIISNEPIADDQKYLELIK